MQTTIDKSGSFIASQFAASGEMHGRRGLSGPAITISHQTGAGAHEVAEAVADLLQQSDSPGAQRWVVLDRQVVEQALEEHHWPRQLAKKMPEDKRSYVDDILDDLFGLRPPSWVLVPQVVETMLRLAEAGHVVLIGRGATVVTARLPNVFHVRLVASMSARIGRVQALRNLTLEEATRFVEKEDRARQRYVRANFHARLDDESLYDLVVNTDRLSFHEAAYLIAKGASRYFQRAKGT